MKLGLSLKYKILIVLTSVPLVGLSLFLALAVNVVEEDKIAYVYDSSLTASKTRAARVRSEISALISVSQSVVYSYSPETRTMAESGSYYFQQESRFSGLLLFALNSETGLYERVVNLEKPGSETLMTSLEPQAMGFVERASKEMVVVDRPFEQVNSILLALRFGEVSDPKHVVAISIFDVTEMAEAFLADSGSTSFLVGIDNSKVLFGQTQVSQTVNVSVESVVAELQKKKVPEGIGSLKAADGTDLLASFVTVGIGELKVISLVEKASALAAVSTLMRSSILFFLGVLSVTLMISVIASHRLTSTLRRLMSATHRLATGELSARVDIKSRDEIGNLASSFNSMASELERLIQETADKARMESELATARAVQETLFPEPTAELGPVQVAGHYEPASECGGDWWYYSENGDYVYLWIGDATGHGAPAALLTSAARAVASVIQDGPAVSPAQAMGMLNRAICDASKGRMMMTFFLARINKITGQMYYSNASHEAPYLLRAEIAEPSRSDYLSLNEINNPRLGESRDIEFKEASIQLKPNDQLVFYTDGVLDVKSPEAKSWGERRFLKVLSRELATRALPSQALSGVLTDLAEYRSQTALDDDVTLMLCRFTDHRGAA